MARILHMLASEHESKGNNKCKKAVVDNEIG